MCTQFGPNAQGDMGPSPDSRSPLLTSGAPKAMSFAPICDSLLKLVTSSKTQTSHHHSQRELEEEHKVS